MGNVSKITCKWFQIGKKKKKIKITRFNEDFIKKYDEDSNTGYFLEVDVEYSKKLFNSHKDLPFPPEKKRLKRSKNLFVK